MAGGRTSDYRGVSWLTTHDFGFSGILCPSNYSPLIRRPQHHLFSTSRYVLEYCCQSDLEVLESVSNISELPSKLMRRTKFNKTLRFCVRCFFLLCGAAVSLTRPSPAWFSCHVHASSTTSCTHSQGLSSKWTGSCRAGRRLLRCCERGLLAEGARVGGLTRRMMDLPPGKSKNKTRARTRTRGI